MTGKGDDVRPYNRKKFNDNFDRIFGKRSARPTTKVTIEFDMEGNNHDLDTVYKRVEQLIKSKQLTFTQTTRYDWSHNIYLFIPMRFIPSNAIGNCTNRVYN